jgi:hypothetical protein
MVRHNAINAREFKAHLTDLGVSGIHMTNGSHYGARYMGKRVFFTLEHGDREMKNSYVSDLARQMLSIEGLTPQHPDYASRFSSLKRGLRNGLGYG